jgi:hypothetical protein
MATRNPQRVIRECDMILNGDLHQTPEQFQRWVVVQIKKLACQSAARKVEHQQLQNKVRQVNTFATGGLKLK